MSELNRWKNMSKELQRKQAPRNYGFRNNQRWIKEALTHFCCHSVAKSCLTLCDPMDCSTPGFPVLHVTRSLLKFMSTESVMPSSHLILCHPLLLLPSVWMERWCWPAASPEGNNLSCFPVSPTLGRGQLQPCHSLCGIPVFLQPKRVDKKRILWIWYSASS